MHHATFAVGVIVAMDARPAKASATDFFENQIAACQSTTNNVAGSSDVADRVASDIEVLLASSEDDEKIRAAFIKAQPHLPMASSASRAAYCAAAGEHARLAPDAALGDAEELLLLSLEQAGTNSGLSARAAYRLGLAALDADAVGGGSEPVSASTNCGIALQLGRGHASAPGESLADRAFACAADQGRLSGDWLIAAMARLRIARTQLSAAKANADLGAIMRRRAGQDAVDGVALALKTPASLDRDQVLARLIGAALDGDATDYALLQRAVTGLSADAELGAAREALQARLLEADGRTGEASGHARRAVFLEARRPDPVHLQEYLLLLSKLDPARSASNIEAAYLSMEGVRPVASPIDEITGESQFSLGMAEVFRAQLNQILSRQGVRDDEAAIVAAAQVVAESSRQAEIQSVFGEECVPPIGAVQLSDLRDDELILYPILLDNRVELIYGVKKNGGYVRIAPQKLDGKLNAEKVDRQTIVSLVETVRRSLAGGSVVNDWHPAARQLYKTLISPLDEAHALQGINTLIIVPDGPLRGLPFSALISNNDAAFPAFLVEKLAVSIVPSLAYAQAGPAEAGKNARILTASVEQETVIGRRFFERLSGAGGEAADAATTSLQNFKSEQLGAELSRRRYNVLHLATHAAFNGRSDRSYIVASDKSISLADLRRLISRSRVRGDELDLLVLSACETALGDDQASMGLAGAAVQSGARGALASLWKVENTGVKSLMERFYQKYRRGDTKAQALREAQLAMLKGGASARDWAGFILIGAWR